MILYLGNKLASKGKNPTAVDTLGKRLQEIYPDMIRVSSRQNFLFRLMDMWWTIIFHRKKIDLVIIDTYSTLAFNYAWTSARICRFFNIPYLPIIHGGSFENRIVQSYKRVSDYLHFADHVVTPSGFLQRVILQRIKIQSLIIPNAIELDAFSNAGRSVYQAAPRIFWLRAYQELYNPILAVHILKEIRSRFGVDAHLTMVGPDKDGSYSKVKQEVVNLQLEDYVTLSLGLPQAEWVNLARSCTVFLNTTTVDNTPVSLIEAMALGLPIVSTAVGGISDLIEDNKEGFLFSSGDGEKAAELIFKLHQEADHWNKSSLYALRKAEYFDWENSIKPKWKKLLDNYA